MNSETTNTKSLEKKNDRNRLFLSLKEKKYLQNIYMMS